MDKPFPIEKIENYSLRYPGPPRRIEVHTVVGNSLAEVPDDTPEELLGDIAPDVVYIGVGVVFFQHEGQMIPQEIPFQISGASNIEEAFNGFDDSFNKAKDELIERSNQSDIQVASEHDLSVLNQIAKDRGIVS